MVAGLIPWWLTGWHFSPFAVELRVVGAIATVAAATVLISAFVQFVVEGIGTPAPIAETRHLVVRGLYRYVRNPMYVAVITAIAGQALLFGQLGLLLYASIVGASMFAFVRLYEEPRLTERFGDEYTAYRRSVPGWWPRFKN